MAWLLVKNEPCQGSTALNQLPVFAPYWAPNKPRARGSEVLTLTVLHSASTQDVAQQLRVSAHLLRSETEVPSKWAYLVRWDRTHYSRFKGSHFLASARSPSSKTQALPEGSMGEDEL